MKLHDTNELLSGCEYPATTSELISEYGDNQFELQNGTETVRDALSRLGEQTYESPQDATEAVFCGLSHRAIGRRFYSDRDPTCVAEDGPIQVSF